MRLFFLLILISCFAHAGDVVIFPGSFDPPTRGHIAHIEKLLEMGFDRVYIPVNTRGPKAYKAGLEDRINMLDSILNRYGDRVAIMPEPAAGKDAFFDAVARREQGKRVFSAMGEDGFQGLPDAIKTAEERNFLIFKRPGQESEDLARLVADPNITNIRVEEGLSTGISSSRFRNSVKAGTPEWDVLSPGAQDYLRSHPDLMERYRLDTPSLKGRSDCLMGNMINIILRIP